MEGKVCKCCSQEDSDNEVSLQNASDEEDQHFPSIPCPSYSSGRKSGCCWELFEVYRHLKSLGYIVGRHWVVWSLKGIKSSHKPVALEGTEERKQLLDLGSKVVLSLRYLFSELQINDLRPDFDVYLPNNRFRKSSPSDPSFLPYMPRGHPPSRAEIETLERQCRGITLKICLDTEEWVSFFSFDKVELLVLPWTLVPL